MLEYFVVGWTVTITYGEPRFTNDIDVVLDLPIAQVSTFCNAFSKEEFYLSQEAVREAVEKQLQFNLIHPASGLKVDFMIISDSAFDRSRIRQLPVLESGDVPFPPPKT